MFIVCAGVFALVWALLKLGWSNQGWALYCLCGADMFAVVALILSFVLLCVRVTRSGYDDDEIAMLQRS